MEMGNKGLELGQKDHVEWCAREEVLRESRGPKCREEQCGDVRGKNKDGVKGVKHRNHGST